MKRYGYRPQEYEWQNPAYEKAGLYPGDSVRTRRGDSGVVMPCNTDYPDDYRYVIVNTAQDIGCWLPESLTKI